LKDIDNAVDGFIRNGTFLRRIAWDENKGKDHCQTNPKLNSYFDKGKPYKERKGNILPRVEKYFVRNRIVK